MLVFEIHNVTTATQDSLKLRSQESRQIQLLPASDDRGNASPDRACGQEGPKLTVLI